MKILTTCLAIVILFIKIDTQGNLLWQKSIGGNEIEFAYDAVQLQNSNIIAVGDSRSDNGDIPLNNGFTDLLIITINE